MIPLSQYIDFSSPYTIDGHIHLFSHRGSLKEEPEELLLIGFPDLELDHPDKYKDMVSLYKNYKGNALLGATGLTVEEIRRVYEEMPERIVAFGELKLYNEFAGEPVPYKRISTARRICSFSRQVGCLPVYIHYELTNTQETEAFRKLLADYSDVPIILCHCGMNETNQSFAYNATQKLARECGNLWIDLSWSAAEWFGANPMMLLQLPGDRIFWGSDRSPLLEASKHKSMTVEDIYKYQKDIRPYVRSDANLKKLFHL